jgi:hypothetical protein
MNTIVNWLNRRGFFSRGTEKIEITVETKESWEINWFRRSKTSQCPHCKAETVFVPADLGLQIIKADGNEIEKLISDGKIHFTDTNDKEKMICLTSLKNEYETRKNTLKIIKNSDSENL